MPTMYFMCFIFVLIFFVENWSEIFNLSFTVCRNERKAQIRIFKIQPDTVSLFQALSQWGRSKSGRVTSGVW